MSSISVSIREKVEANKPIAAKGWKQHLLYLGLAWAAILSLFFRDVSDMVGIWWNSSTFNHCLLVAPVLIWLIVRRREEVAEITPQAWKPGLIYMAAASFGWFLGDLAGVALARQLGLVMMLQGAVLTILGRNVSVGLAFPLFYAFFMVPFGDELVPILQTVTADISMAMLGFVGIPAYIEGIFITTPTGYFRVAEACSGIEFLIAMIAYGALVANLCFKSWFRRILFMILCIVTPVIANGIRAWGTIVIAHHTSIDFAASFDHIFYGWIFFALVLMLVMLIAWRWFDRAIDDPAFNPKNLVGDIKSNFSAAKAMIFMAVVFAIPIAWSAAIASKDSPIPQTIEPFDIVGWEKITYQPQYDWNPYFAGSNHNVGQRYRDAEGRIVDMVIIVYDRQEEGRELIGFGQGAVGPDSAWSWTAAINAPNGARGEHIIAPGPVSRDVYSFYRINGTTTGSGVDFKLATLLSKLSFGNQQAVAIIISAEHGENIDHKANMEKFIADIGSIDALADLAAGLN